MTTLAYHPNMDAGELREYIAARHATHLVIDGSSDACQRARRMVGLLARHLGVTREEVTRDVVADFEAMEEWADHEAAHAAALAADRGGE